MKKIISVFMSVVMLFSIMAVPAYASDVETASPQAIGPQDQIDPQAGVMTNFYKYEVYKNSAGTDVKTPTGYVRGATQTGTYVSTTDILEETGTEVLVDCFTRDYASAIANLIGTIPKITVSTLIEEGFSEAELQAVIDANPNSNKINYKITTYTKSGSNSVYSDHVYAIRLYGNAQCTGYFALAGVQKITQAT